VNYEPVPSISSILATRPYIPSYCVRFLWHPF